jgi:hypothetical protein
MEKYNPAIAPDPVEWLSLDEQIRIDLALAYHRKARVQLPDEKIHAILHAIIENQIAGW